MDQLWAVLEVHYQPWLCCSSFFHVAQDKTKSNARGFTIKEGEWQYIFKLLGQREIFSYHVAPATHWIHDVGFELETCISLGESLPLPSLC